MSTHKKNICKMIGVIFLVIGISAFAYKGYTYMNIEKVIVSQQMTAGQTKHSPAPQMIGAVGMFIGCVFLIVGTRKEELGIGGSDHSDRVYRRV